MFALDSVIMMRTLTVALRYLHRLNLAHGDMKPSNIGVSHSLDFVMIDLGSVSKFGDRTSSTPAYIPRDKHTPDLRSSADLDWWMLSVTMAEKCCGEHGLDIGTGASTQPLHEIRGHLQKYLPAAVWNRLKNYIN